MNHKFFYIVIILLASGSNDLLHSQTYIFEEGYFELNDTLFSLSDYSADYNTGFHANDLARAIGGKYKIKKSSNNPRYRTVHFKKKGIKLYSGVVNQQTKSNPEILAISFYFNNSNNSIVHICNKVIKNSMTFEDFNSDEDWRSVITETSLKFEIPNKGSIRIECGPYSGVLRFREVNNSYILYSLDVDWLNE